MNRMSIEPANQNTQPQELLNNHTVGFCSNCPSSSTVREKTSVLTCKKSDNSTTFILPPLYGFMLSMPGSYRIYPYGEGEQLCYKCIGQILSPKSPVQFVPLDEHMSLPNELLGIQTLEGAIAYLKSERPVSYLTTKSSSIQDPNPCLEPVQSDNVYSEYYQISQEDEWILINIINHEKPFNIDIDIERNNKSLEKNIDDDGKIQELTCQKPFICSGSKAYIRFQLGDIEYPIELKDFGQFINVSALMIAVTKFVDQLNMQGEYDERQVALDLMVIYSGVNNHLRSI